MRNFASINGENRKKVFFIKKKYKFDLFAY